MARRVTVVLLVFALVVVSIGLLWRLRRSGIRTGAVDPSLRQPVGGSIEGTVVDAASGRQCQARMTVSLRESSYAHVTTGWSRDTGLFLFEGLRPGDYDISASTIDGRAGLLEGVRVEAANEVSSLRVKVEPGARVRVRLAEGVGTGFLTVCRGGAVVANDVIHSPSIQVEVIPAGSATVRFDSASGGPPMVKQVEVTVGEEKELVFGEGE